MIQRMQHPFERRWYQLCPALARRESGQDVFDGGYTWAGSLEGRPDASVIFTVRDGRISGSINALADGFYQLRATRDGGQLVAQVEGEPLRDAVEIPQPGGDPVVPDEDRTVQRQGAAQIDMLVVYTRAARQSVSYIPGTIDLAIAETNNAMYRSGIDGRLRLVRSAELAYNEGGWSSRDALYRLQARGDGHLDEVHSMREASSADLVVLTCSPKTEPVRV